MIRGFYNGVSGVKTQSFGMDVWSNNISNINNVGFKASLPEFKSIFYQSMVSAGNKPTTDQVGLGAVKQATALDMGVGSFQNTDNKFDFAIQGNGFFGVKDRLGNTYYTRAGNFDIDAAGNLVDPSGKFVQGTMNIITPIKPSENAINTYGSATPITDAYTLNQISSLSLDSESSQQNIKLPSFLYQPAKATTKVDIKGNLNSKKIYENVEPQLDTNSYSHTIDTANKTISINGDVTKSQSVLSYKKGDSVTVRISSNDGKFSDISTEIKDDGTWSIDDYRLNYMDLENATISAKLLTNQEVANKQKMSTDIFTASGEKQLLTLKYTKQLPQQKDSTSWDVIATITDANGNEVAKNAGVLQFGDRTTLISSTLDSVGGIALNFGEIGKTDSVYSGLTSSYASSQVDIKKDGYAEGVLKGYEVSDDAVIMANFNNGMMFPIARLALYHFQNDQGLAKMSENVYAKTSNSGEPFFYKDKSGETLLGAKIASNRLEMSNVDLGQALTEIIVIQKAYDASSKSITTSDQMIQTAINMKK